MLIMLKYTIVTAISIHEICELPLLSGVTCFPHRVQRSFTCIKLFRLIL